MIMNLTTKDVNAKTIIESSFEKTTIKIFNSLTYDLTLKSLSKERQAYFEKLQPMIRPFK